MQNIAPENGPSHLRSPDDSHIEGEAATLREENHDNDIKRFGAYETDMADAWETLTRRLRNTERELRAARDDVMTATREADSAKVFADIAKSEIRWLRMKLDAERSSKATDGNLGNNEDGVGAQETRIDKDREQKKALRKRVIQLRDKSEVLSDKCKKLCNELQELTKEFNQIVEIIEHPGSDGGVDEPDSVQGARPNCCCF